MKLTNLIKQFTAVNYTCCKMVCSAYYTHVQCAGLRGSLFGDTALSIMAFSITTLSIMAFSIMTLSIMAFSITTLSIMAFSITTLSIRG
jgi:hypothetical protein